jgi:ADP-ribosylglycohydrolase
MTEPTNLNAKFLGSMLGSALGDAIGEMAFRSVPFALYAFLCHPESFEDCLFCAILNGGDRDTLGAMACAVSGAYLGIDAIPTAWRARLEGGDEIEKFALAPADRTRQNT